MAPILRSSFHSPWPASLDPALTSPPSQQSLAHYHLLLLNIFSSLGFHDTAFFWFLFRIIGCSSSVLLPNSSATFKVKCPEKPPSVPSLYFCFSYHMTPNGFKGHPYADGCESCVSIPKLQVCILATLFQCVVEPQACEVYNAPMPTSSKQQQKSFDYFLFLLPP